MNGWSVCPGSRCNVAISARLVFCSECWQHVPNALKERIAGLWGSSELSKELRRAVEDARRAIDRSKK